LELQVEKPEMLKPLLQHYGALFLGYDTPVPYGDYMAGPNHTLPTGRTARFSGCLNPLTFLRPQSWIQANSTSSSLASDTAQFAELEGLTAHALSAKARCATVQVS
jgi:histidinol dehydrogenase